MGTIWEIQEIWDHIVISIKIQQLVRTDQNHLAKDNFKTISMEA